jgi:hypothetical protein
MDDYMQSDFLVVGTALREIYHDIRNAVQVDTQEMENIADGLAALSTTLKRFVDRACKEPQSEQASMSVKEPFEDVIALSWQIAWTLHEEGLNADSLDNIRKPLRQLHEKLEELIVKGTQENAAA